jgi:hypothetical protein
MTHIKTFENYDEESEHDIDTILKAYLECVIFTEEGYHDEDDNDSFEGKGIYDFSETARKTAKDQIEWFVSAAADALDDISDESIGHDIWYTRNGHGVGFWSRGYEKNIDETLCELCEILGNVDAYVSENDEICFGPSDKYKKFDLDKYKIEKRAKKYNL